MTKREPLTLQVVSEVISTVIYGYAADYCEPSLYNEKMEKIARFYDNFKSYFEK